MDNIEDIVRKLLKECRASEIEIEARIRRQLVSSESQQQLVDNLGAEWVTEVYTERRRISKSSRRSAYRWRSGAAGTLTICKSSIAREEANDAWCTLHVSIEVPTPSMSNALVGVQPVQVTRQRATIEGHYVDVVHEEDREHRVEVEVCDAESFDPESTLRVVRRVCAMLQGSRCFVGYYDWLTIVHITRTRFGPFCVDSGSYQKPRTMTMAMLSEIANVGSWVATSKVDGERRFIVALDDRVFSVGLAKDVKYEGCVQDNSGILVLDCEYTKGNRMFHVFDVVVMNGAYLAEAEGLLDRLNIAQRLRCAMSDDLSNRVNVKAHHMFSSFDRLCELHDELVKNDGLATDGIIFVDITKGYMQQAPKWKPHSTVDLAVTGEGELVTCDGWVVDVPVDGQDINEGIWELDYDRGANLLHPKRPRPDKPRANSKSIVEINMLHAVPGSVFSGVGCYLMRKYHNRVKANMIRGANDKNAVILDIGTGQGGDVTKWSRANTVYCIEPSTRATRDMLDRHGDVSKVHVINVHLRDLDSTMIKKKVDIFTAFFCMNQFEDADWESLYRLVADIGSSKCRLLAIAMTAPRAHKGGCFNISITGTSKYKISIHGTRILGIDERAVDPDVLTKRMGSCKMGLVEQMRLNSNDFMTKEEKRLSSMYEMLVYKRKNS